MIYVDADACPVRDDIITIALRHNTPVMMVCNGGIRPYPHSLISLKIVATGPDEADKWIAETMTGNDILVTNDIPLAAKVIAKGAAVMRADGSLLTEANIGSALATRDLMSDIRAADPFHQSKSKAVSKSTKGQFRQKFDQLVQQKSISD